MKQGARIGAAAGIVCWLLVGIITGMYFGGYGAITILHNLTGGSVDATLFARVFVVAGMAVGIMCAGSVSVVVGGLIGALVGSSVAALAGVRHGHAA